MIKENIVSEMTEAYSLVIPAFLLLGTCIPVQPVIFSKERLKEIVIYSNLHTYLLLHYTEQSYALDLHLCCGENN